MAANGAVAWWIRVLLQPAPASCHRSALGRQPDDRRSGIIEPMDEKQTLIEKLQGIARDLGTTAVARHEFLRRSGVSERKIQRLFGSYNDLVLAAGLSPRSFPTSDAPIYSDGDLLNHVVRVLRLRNSKLTRIFFERNAGVSTSPCERRFGGWINTIKAAGELLNPDEDAGLLQRIREYTVQTCRLDGLPHRSSKATMTNAMRPSRKGQT